MPNAGKHIQDYDWLYSMLRPTVDNLFRWSMRRYRCLGRDNIPTDGQVIYAPNHQNGLLDALAVLSLDSRPKVFVSRADIHRNPRLAKVLAWLKIMPINRMRDGVDSVRHNDETMDRAVQVLHDGVPFCIMPEGTHRQQHSLLPLQKGIFRIALRAVEANPSVPTYIVPVGLEYGDWQEMWDSLTISIGAPIRVDEYVRAHAELTEPQLILGLREELASRMRQLILFVPDDEQYQQAWLHLDAHRPAPWQRPQPALPKALRMVLLLLLAPLFLLSGLLTWPLWLLLHVLRPRIQDVAFRNSAEFVLTWLLLFPTFGLLLPFWFFIKEYRYQFRQIAS